MAARAYDAGPGATRSIRMIRRRDVLRPPDLARLSPMRDDADDMDVLEAVARVVTGASAVALLLTGLAVLVGEARVHRSKPVDRRGGPLALVNFAGIAGFGVLAAFCAVTLFGCVTAAQPLAAVARLLGLGLLAAAGILALSGIRAMGKHMASRAEVRADTPLLTSGPFAIVRHPLYLSILLLWLGGALALLNVLLGAGFAAFVPLFVARGRQEEELLTGHFGAAYRDYRDRVPMLLPRPRR